MDIIKTARDRLAEGLAPETGIADLDPLDMRLQAEQLAARLGPAIVSRTGPRLGIGRGVHGRRRSGDGDSFWQYSPYEAGQPAHRIDWRRSARSDQYYIREREQESPQTFYLWCDLGDSMNYRYDAASPLKAERAMVLTLVIARILATAGEKVALLDGTSKPMLGAFGFERVFEAAARALTDPMILPPGDIPRGRPGQLIYISDFLSLDAVDGFLARQRQSINGGALIQILDPAEWDFPFTGRRRFEATRTIDLVELNRSQDVRSDYRRRLGRLVKMVEQKARRRGWAALLHRTDQPPGPLLLALLNSFDPASLSHA